MGKSKNKVSDDSKIPLKNIQKIIDNGDNTDEQLLLDACPYPLIIGTIDGYFLGLNAAAETIFQQPRKKLIGTSGYPQIELDAGERRRQVLHKMVKEKKPQLLEDYERGNWWRTLFIPIVNKKEEVIKFAVVIYNISEEKSRERKISEKNEEFWRRLIQYSNNSFFIVDDNGIIRYVTDSVKSILGYEPREMIGNTIFDYLFDLDKKKANEFFEKVLSKKSKKSISHRVIGKNNKTKYMETTANNLLDHEIVQGIIITIRDITDTHQAEIETQETKKYLENIINSTSEIIFSLDSDERVSLWNDQAVKTSGYTTSSIIGKKIDSLSFIQNNKSLASYVQQCYQHPSKPFDVKIQTKHGDSRLLRIHGSPVKTDKNVVRGVVFNGRDITSDAQIHGQLVTGASYLILEDDNSKAIDILNGLLLNEYHGLFITRDPSQRYFDSPSGTLPLTQYSFTQEISVEGNNPSILSDPQTLKHLITSFFSEHNKSIVLIDRLDYLIALYGFTQVMQTIYAISSIASKNDGIILIRLNPAVISSTEQAILTEELKKLPEQSVSNITIDNKLFDILQYIEKQNMNKTLVSFKNIGKEFSITKVTTAKRINALEEKKLVAIKKRGRLKTIYITDKGRRLLQRRSVV